MKVFISYAREDAGKVATLRDDLERSRHDVWLDADLVGGQSWWDAILDAIQSTDVFIVALTPDWLRSRASAAEHHYAVACRRAVLPVMIDLVDPQLAPASIANAQFVDYCERSADAAIGLMNALNALPPALALPDPRPCRPPAPMAYLSKFREQVEASSLTIAQQRELSAALCARLGDDDLGHDSIVHLLHELSGRADLDTAVASDIARALAGRDAAPPSLTLAVPATPAAVTLAVPAPAAVTLSATTPAGVAPAPLALAATTTAPLPPPIVGTSLLAAPSPRRALAADGAPLGPFTPVGYAVLLLAAVTCVGSVLPMVIGALNVRHPARRAQSLILIAVGVPFFAIFLWVLVLGIRHGSTPSAMTMTMTTVG